jgi:cytochrome c oxidase subunit 2
VGQGSNVNNKQRSVGSIVLGVLTLASTVISTGAHADELNMPVGVTEISRAVYDLHMLIFYLCCVIGAVVFAAMFYSMFRHRKSLGYQPASFHEHTGIEVLWTVVPLLILIGMAVPATSTLIKMYDTGGEDLTIEVRGYQWKWEYKYLDDNLQNTVSFFSNLSTPREEIENKQVKNEFYLLEVDKPLVIPVNRKVRFLVTSNDVIHAFWVPDFGIKRDAIPGMLNELWAIVEEEGIYRGQCTELCGKDHEQTYGKFCTSCHQVDGKGLPPVFPALAGGAITTGPRDEHIRQVYEGVAGTAMTAFGQQLNAAELAAVVHYERHSWGNSIDDVTQPVDVLDWLAAQE